MSDMAYPHGKECDCYSCFGRSLGYLAAESAAPLTQEALAGVTPLTEKCEGCGKQATHISADGVDLCATCYYATPVSRAVPDTPVPAPAEPTEREAGEPSGGDNAQLQEWVSKPLNAWQPESDAVTLAVLGKLAEELAECSAIVSRCIIQGIDEAEPVTGKLNREALEKEIADVRATIEDATQHFGLRTGFMATRERLKREHLSRWHDLLRGSRV